MRATIEVIHGLSAHAGRSELLKWLDGFKRAPGHTYVVHGEPQASQALADTLRQDRHWVVDVARDGQTVTLFSETSARLPPEEPAPADEAD